MDNLKKTIKHHTKQIGLSIIAGLLLAQPSFADDSAILGQIRDTTNKIYTEMAVQLPAFIAAYFKDLVEMAKAVTVKEDPNKYISNNQPMFGTIFNAYIATTNQQASMSQQLTQQFLTSNGTNPLPAQANELNYTVLNGSLLKPPTQYEQAPDTNTLSQNYLKHLAGINFSLTPPNPKWGTKGNAGKQYAALYNTSAAITSYNAYLLSGLYQQKEQDNNRLSLLQQASDAKWFVDLQTEDVGLVFRQVLMYTSQIYVSLDRLLKVQQQQLAATAMTNTLLLIMANSVAGQGLAAQAANQ